MFHNSKSAERGFTMIEMLTVLVIIGVLTTIAAVTYGKARDRARLAKVKTNVGEIVLSLTEYARDHNGRYPALTVYHNLLPPSGSITTDPNPPDEPDEGYPAVRRRMGNAIIGGSPPLADTPNPLLDDFFRDVDPGVASAFRSRPGEPQDPAEPMHPVDELALNGLMEAYPVNPLKGPGIPMVNVAYMLYDYDTQTNDFQWVEMTIDSGEIRTGLSAAIPVLGGFYEPIPIIWNEITYPQGDFAYIPMEFNSEQGRYANGYWIICYGDLNTLHTSPYSKYSLDPVSGLPVDPAFANWPNLPAPYGDGSPGTPPVAGTVEYEIKRIMFGALDVRATIFDDQFRSNVI